MKEIANEIRIALDEHRASVGLTFTEEGHRYTLPGLDKIVSVSGIVHKYHEPFDRDEVALRVAKGDETRMMELIAEWEEKGRVARLTGNYVHYHLEQFLVEKFELDKEVREPILDGLDDTIITKGDKMIIAGKLQIDKMIERGAYLIDTEVVMGSVEAGYVGQCDCAWVGKDPEGNVKLCMTDWKTNKPSKFSDSYFDKPMYYPFNMMNDNAVGKYSLQLSLYERLMLDMLKNSHPDLSFSNSIIVSLRQKPVGTYKEFRVGEVLRQLAYNLELDV